MGFGIFSERWAIVFAFNLWYWSVDKKCGSERLSILSEANYSMPRVIGKVLLCPESNRTLFWAVTKVLVTIHRVRHTDGDCRGRTPCLVSERLLLLPLVSAGEARTSERGRHHREWGSLGSGTCMGRMSELTHGLYISVPTKPVICQKR